MYNPSQKAKDNKENTEIEVFTVPLSSREINGNIVLNTTNHSKPSKEQIVNQAFKFHSQSNFIEAAKYYQLFIDQGFKDHIVFTNYGVVLIKLGKLIQAEISTRKAIKLNPNYATAHYNLGNILKGLNNIKEAALSYQKAIKLNPNLAQAHLNLGSMLLELGKSKEVEICYSRAIELQPNLTTALMSRASYFFREEEFDKALRDSDECKTDVSRAFSLEILYALGRIDEIYKRIEKASKLDDKSIRLAAFSSFIEVQEKKESANNFCRNPLSFLYYSNLKNHRKDYDDFIKNMISDLRNFETTWEPQNKTTHNGFQTPSNINLLKKSSETISQLRSIIFKELDLYYLKFKKESCTYIQKWPNNKNLYGWHVILKKQGYQDAHIHPGGWLSGVIYLKVVPSLGKDEGAIEFSLNLPNSPNIKSPKSIHHPEVGDIVFFPSSLHHRTIPFSTDTDRIVIAFDLMPN